MGDSAMILRLETVLQNIANSSWSQWIYVRSGDAISADTRCIVIDPDVCELSDDEFTPKIVKEHEMVEFLSIGDVVSVLENLKAQKADADLDLKLRSLDYYFKKDAYLNHG